MTSSSPNGQQSTLPTGLTEHPSAAQDAARLGCIQHLLALLWHLLCLGPASSVGVKGCVRAWGPLRCDVRTWQSHLCARSPASVSSPCYTRGLRWTILCHLLCDGSTAPAGDTTGVLHPGFQGRVKSCCVGKYPIASDLQASRLVPAQILGEGPRMVCGCPQHPDLCAWPLHRETSLLQRRADNPSAGC